MVKGCNCKCSETKIINKTKEICTRTRLPVCLVVLSVLTWLLVYQFGWFMGASSSRSDKGDMQQRPVIVAAQARHTASLIFLHGLGDTGHGWGESFRELKLHNIRVVCPHAPVQPVTLNAGMKMPSWFDIKTLSMSTEEDESGITKSSEIVKKLVEEEEKQGIPSDRILLGGFSQGGSVALFTALGLDKPLAGVVALSCWLPLHGSFQTWAAERQKELPILQCHGDADPMVNYSFGQMTNALIKNWNKNIIFNKYSGMGHSSSPKEMEDIKEFLERIIPPEK